MSSTERIFTSTNKSNAPMTVFLEKIGWRFSGELEGIDDGDPEMGLLPGCDTRPLASRKSENRAADRIEHCHGERATITIAPCRLPTAPDRYDTMKYRRCGRSGYSVTRDLPRPLAELRR